MTAASLHGGTDAFSTFAEWTAELGDPWRWGLIAWSYGQTVLELGSWWAHPLLLALVWIRGVGPAQLKQMRSALVAAIFVAVLKGDFLLCVITVADLRWHLSTSCNCLWLQTWLSLLLGLFLVANLRLPQALPSPRGRKPVRQQASRRR